MFKKKLFILTIISTLLLSACACDSSFHIGPADASEGKYSTQTSMTSLEYGLFLNKQITVYTNQLTTRMAMAKNSENGLYEQEAYMANESVEIMQAALDEVITTMPATTSEDDRDAVIVAMETALGHMKDYATAVENKEDVANYVYDFQNDFTVLTGLANLYYQ